MESSNFLDPNVAERFRSSLITASAAPENRTKVYLAGPMTIKPEHNYPAFTAAAADLRERGFNVLNPAETDGGDTSKPREYYLAKDVLMVVEADAIVALPDWQRSEGFFNLERIVAKALKKPIWLYPDLAQLQNDESILEEAGRITRGARQSNYGHPLDDFSRTAGMMSSLLGIHLKPEHVGLMMILVKVSREMNAHNRDNLVDIAGYAWCVGELMDEQKRRANG